MAVSGREIEGQIRELAELGDSIIDAERVLLLALASGGLELDPGLAELGGEVTESDVRDAGVDWYGFGVIPGGYKRLLNAKVEGAEGVS